MASMTAPPQDSMPTTRGYQQEMLEESIRHNIIIAMDTGSGKTHIAVLRIKYEVEREHSKVAWFFAPTVALCAQQKAVIQTYLPVSVGLVSGALEPDQWKSASSWERVLNTHRVIVSTPQVFLDALRHAYVDLGKDISLLVFDEAHHAADNHPYNRIMLEFYHRIPPRPKSDIIYGVGQISRPSVLGLTASPIYGGDVARAFQTLESNLDSTIRSPRLNRLELAQFVHRPIFQHVMYEGWQVPPFSTNLATLSNLIQSLKIDDDPFVISLRKKLAAAQPHSPEYYRIDQQLSATIRSEKTFTIKGLRDFGRAALDILNDFGPWAADWFVWQIVERAREAANPYKNIMASWKESEKAHLMKLLKPLTLSAVSFHPDDVMDDCSDKVNQLVTVLLNEQIETEGRDEAYSALIFVQRRDSVLALAEVLRHHPFTKDHFRIGVLIGTSDSSFRHSFLDITRKFTRDTQEETMSQFRAGELNLIVATAVAEEGIDIQACGSVIRWDPPNNMASWAQSRGRARRKRSTFTLMFQRGSSSQHDVTKWEDLERRMVEMYNDPSKDLAMSQLESMYTPQDDFEEDDEVFVVESTGAQLNLHSAIAHLSHFCAVIPTTAHVDNRPIYDLDPPEMPLRWHISPSSSVPIYNGPWGSKITLPRCLPLSCREFTVEMKYRSKTSAHRHVAFKAYLGLYKAGLLNENLLPLTSVVEPDREEEVKKMLKDVEKRVGMANVDLQMDPWAGLEVEADGHLDYWWTAKMCIGDLPPLILFTRSEPVELSFGNGPVLYRPGMESPTQVSLTPIGRVHQDEGVVGKAKDYTRRVFWSLNWARMEWDNLEFAYLFYPETPLDEENDVWVKRRAWLEEIRRVGEAGKATREYVANARAFGEAFRYTVGHADDPTVVHKEFGRPYRFVEWRNERLSDEEEEDMRGTRRYLDGSPIEIRYPLLVVVPFHPRCNFLIPTKSSDTTKVPSPEIKPIHLIPEYSGISLISSVETEYAFLLPSVLRSIGMSLTISSLRTTLFHPCPSLRAIPLTLLANAMTASSAGECFNYQRLETLGDTVLKFLVSLQVLAEYPLWHEGYLTKKKDHTVSNVRLAKEDLKRGVFRWIIRDRMLGRKWRPKYVDKVPVVSETDMEEAEIERELMPVDEQDGNREGKLNRRKKGKEYQQRELSTKVLADVVESLIGAAYLRGSFDLGYECAKLFDLELKWLPPPQRIEQLLSRLEPDTHIPPALAYVEKMIGYTFEHKLLLLEALTHSSYQQDVQTVSYERMEFLGDSVLDMVVTDYLYRAPGKNYSPGHIHLRRSAVVNTHFLAYICLGTSYKFDAVLPRVVDGDVQLEADGQEITLWKCLLHSSSRVMDDQAHTYSRFRKRREEIDTALQNDVIFPWAAFTRLQAPKFFSDIIESVIGAVFLDSKGNFDTARSVITQLGIMPALERIVTDNVDVWHPVSRIAQWAQKHDRTLDFKFDKERGAIRCSVLVDGKVEAVAQDEYRGSSSQEEVKLIAAEEASRALKFRNTHMNQLMMKGRNRVPSSQKGKVKKGKMKEVNVEER